MLEASKKENISLNGVEIEDTFAEIFTLMEISPANTNAVRDFAINDIRRHVFKRASMLGRAL